MKTKVKRRSFSRFVCVLLTVLTVFGAMSSLFIAGPLEAKAASSWYTIVKSSSEVIGSSIWYYGYDYKNKQADALLEFEFTSGYVVEYGDQTYYASCAQMGYMQPTNRVTLKGLLTIDANGIHTDNFNNSEKYGAHYLGTESDPTWRKGRQIPYDFIFRCFYYAHKLHPNGVDGTSVLWTNGFMEEAVSIAYRYEWDTRLMQYVTGHFVGNTWTPYAMSNWTQNKNFNGFLPSPNQETSKKLVEVADEILRAALTDADHISGRITNENPDTGKTDNYGIYLKFGNDVHVLRRLDTADINDGADANYQDLFLYAVNENPPEEFYKINLTKVDKDDHAVPLSGAKFSLYRKAGSVYASYKTGTTDSSGHILWDSLPAGDYIVSETSAPSGYELNSTDIYITLPGSGHSGVPGSYDIVYTSDGSEVTVYDPHESYKVAVQKEDERYTEQRRYLTGAWFALYKDNGTGTYVQYGTEQETKQRDGIGLCAYWSDLPKGDYYVKETRAPSGYALNDTKVYFSLPYTDADGERGSTYRINQWDGSNADLFISNPKYGTLKIKKVDIKGDPISGVT